MKETEEKQVRSLSWEDPLEEDMATTSVFLPGELPIDRGTRWATVHGWGCKESDTTETT